MQGIHHSEKCIKAKDEEEKVIETLKYSNKQVDDFASTCVTPIKSYVKSSFKCSASNYKVSPVKEAEPKLNNENTKFKIALQFQNDPTNIENESKQFYKLEFTSDDLVESLPSEGFTLFNQENQFEMFGFSPELDDIYQSRIRFHLSTQIV